MKRILGERKLYLFLLVLSMVIFPFLVGQSGYFMSLFVTACIFVISAMALNLLVGYGGQISVGQAGFLSAGGYAVAILSQKFGLSIWLLLPLAGVITAIISLVIGLPAVRLRGHFLAVATMGFGLSIPQIALNWESLTMGYNGMSVMRPPWLSGDLPFFYLIVVTTLVVAWIITNIVKSGMGRAFVAIRDSEVAAQATGINVAFYKTIMFVISAFFTGIAGGLYAYWFGYVSPQDFTILTSLLILGMVVVGGLASIPGAVIGAVLFTVIPHFTDAFIGVTNIVIGIAIILIIMYRSEGLVSLVNHVRVPGKDDRVKGGV
ncbi:MAG: branched-chain amino acid ABC transporter permease [Bacillaceae bacterium]|nr:branched-chain amino acid ABC transporter permease [Bacillaceae bacterium]